jgi:hypothetical protein
MSYLLDQEELREKDKLVKELQAAVKLAENQVHGLQTVMVTKNAANHRLEAELRQVSARQGGCTLQRPARSSYGRLASQPGQ